MVTVERRRKFTIIKTPKKSTRKVTVKEGKKGGSGKSTTFEAPAGETIDVRAGGQGNTRSTGSTQDIGGGTLVVEEGFLDTPFGQKITEAQVGSSGGKAEDDPVVQKFNIQEVNTRGQVRRARTIGGSSVRGESPREQRIRSLQTAKEVSSRTVKEGPRTSPRTPSDSKDDEQFTIPSAFSGVGDVLLRDPSAFSRDEVNNLDRGIDLIRKGQEDLSIKSQQAGRFTDPRIDAPLFATSVAAGAGQALDVVLKPQDTAAAVARFIKNPISSSKDLAVQTAKDFKTKPLESTGEFLGSAVLLGQLLKTIAAATKASTTTTKEGLIKSLDKVKGPTKIVIEDANIPKITREINKRSIRINIPNERVPLTKPTGKPRVSVDINKIKLDRVGRAEILKASGKAASEGKIFRVSIKGIEKEGLGRQTTKIIDETGKEIKVLTSTKNIDKLNTRITFASSRLDKTIFRTGEVTKFQKRGAGQVSRTLTFDETSGVFKPSQATIQIIKKVKPEQFSVKRVLNGFETLQFFNPSVSSKGFSFSARGKDLFKKREIDVVTKSLAKNIEDSVEKATRDAGKVSTVTSQKLKLPKQTANLNVVEKAVQKISRDSKSTGLKTEAVKVSLPKSKVVTKAQSVLKKSSSQATQASAVSAARLQKVRQVNVPVQRAIPQQDARLNREVQVKTQTVPRFRSQSIPRNVLNQRQVSSSRLGILSVGGGGSRGLNARVRVEVPKTPKLIPVKVPESRSSKPRKGKVNTQSFKFTSARTPSLEAVLRRIPRQTGGNAIKGFSFRGL